MGKAVKPKPAEIGGMGREAMIPLYRMVRLIRRVEERLQALFAEGLVPGFIHLSTGQEAVSAGVMSALTAVDTIASTHRGHGHAIAKGLPLDGFFAELFGRDTGVCRGRGGSMHVADMSRGMLGANGIVAAGLPIALGSALAHRSLKRSAIAVAFFGDGALAEGVVHECFNLAMLWRLPLMFVCENNGWGEFLPTAGQLSFTLADLAAAYRLPHQDVDGNDVAAVASVASRVVAAVRAGDGPALLECRTTRMRGHFEGDPQKMRDPAEIAAFAERDSVAIAAAKLRSLGVTSAAIRKLDDTIEEELAAAIDTAKRGPASRYEDAMADVYARPL